MKTSLAVVFGAALVMGAILAGCSGGSPAPASSAKSGTQSPPASNASPAETYRQAFEKPVTVNEAQSPGGERLTVQYAAMAICKAVDVPYQWDKSQNLAGDVCRRFIGSLNVSGMSAKQALTNVVSPLGARYEFDENGVYLCK